MSDAVKRYSFDDPKLSGIRRAFVLATAYDALEAENVRVREERDAYRQLLSEIAAVKAPENAWWKWIPKAAGTALAASNDKGDGT